jgi:hypothetical protein
MPQLKAFKIMCMLVKQQQNILVLACQAHKLLMFLIQTDNDIYFNATWFLKLVHNKWPLFSTPQHCNETLLTSMACFPFKWYSSVSISIKNQCSVASIFPLLEPISAASTSTEEHSVML